MKLTCAAPLLALTLCGPGDAGPEGVDRVVLDQGLLRLSGASGQAHGRNDEKRTEGKAMRAPSDSPDGPEDSLQHNGAEDDVAHHKRDADSHDQDASWAKMTPVRTANLTLVVLAWVSWMYLYNPMTVKFDTFYDSLDIEESERLSGGVLAALWAGMFIYWIAMPVTVLLISLRFATCSGGVPNMVYGVYGGFFTLQLALTVYVVAALGLKLPPCLQLEGLMKSGFVLTVLTCIENYDMGSDVMFPGQVFACTAEVTPKWLASWEEAWIPRFMLPVLEGMKFDGFALTLFVSGAYVPQLLQMPSYIAPIFLALSFASVSMWLSLHWAVGLGAVLSTFGMTIVAIRWIEIVSAKDMWRPVNLLYTSGILIFEDQVRPSGCDPAFRAPMLVATKTMCENLLQSWVQTAFLGLSFESLDAEARFKTLASISVGLAVSGAKIVPMLQFMIWLVGMMRRCEDGRWLGFILISILLMALLFMASTVAKIVFVFTCPSHMWNLTSGCMPA